MREARSKCDCEDCEANVKWNNCLSSTLKTFQLAFKSYTTVKHYPYTKLTVIVITNSSRLVMKLMSLSHVVSDVRICPMNFGPLHKIDRGYYYYHRY